MTYFHLNHLLFSLPELQFIQDVRSCKEINRIPTWLRQVKVPPQLYFQENIMFKMYFSLREPDTLLCQMRIPIMAKANSLFRCGSGRIVVELRKLRGSFRLFLWMQLGKRKIEMTKMMDRCFQMFVILNWIPLIVGRIALCKTQSIVRFLFIVLSNTM